MSYVVVLNHNGSIPLRHIVETKEPYDQEEFKNWYYNECLQELKKVCLSKLAVAKKNAKRTA